MSFPSDVANVVVRVARRALRLSLVPSLVLLPLACEDSPPLFTGPAPEQPLSIGSASQTLQVPRTLQIFTGGGPGIISWETSDQAIASVSESGLVTAKFPGSVTITARRGSRSATLALTATAARIDVRPSPAIVTLNGTQPLTAAARDADGAVISGVPIKWGTLNASIATVDASTGVVTGKGAGTTTITATGGGASGDVTVLVNIVFGAQLAFSSIGTVGNYMCGIEAPTGLAYCWGDNHSGALGLGDQDGSYFPMLVSGARRFSSISVGFYANCGIEAQTRFAYCWGSNSLGQLGDGTTATRSVPTVVGNGSIRFASISAAGDVTCGVEAQTSFGYCWGKGGVIGDGTNSQRSTPTLVGGGSLRFSSIGAGESHACGIEAQTGLAYCWGSNDFGQLGDGTTAHRLVPTLVGGSSRRFTSIDAGWYMTCGIEDQTGLAYCWGRNSLGQLGDGTTTDRLVPTLVSRSGLRFASVNTGGELTCGVEAQTGLGYCWGRNDLGQVGDGTTTGRHVPTLVGGGRPRFSNISSSGFDACGVEVETGFGYCWGFGALVPTLVPRPTAKSGE